MFILIGEIKKSLKEIITEYIFYTSNNRSI